MNFPANLIDEDSETAKLLVRNARSFISDSQAVKHWLKSARQQHMQAASSFSCMGGNEAALMHMHKADGIAALYEQIFGVEK
jgi:hypothetical protein